jgi:site-specific DNA recombinase
MPEDAMITAAIYARKSTEQDEVATEAKSVTRQDEMARAFIAAQGWTVAAPEFIVHDDGISGADFVTRGLMKLVQAATRVPRPFDVLVCADQDRLGRDQIRTPMILSEVIEAGVRIFYYASGQELKLDSPTDRLVSNIRNFGNEWYRYQVRVKTKESLRARAQKGQVAGGRVYGYQNVRRDGFTERAIHPTESAVVRSIFELCATGLGLKRIANRLNDDHVPPPRGAGLWLPSTLARILHRDLYRGQIIWGRVQIMDRHGRTGQVEQRPAKDWVRLERPDLAIVSSKLWRAAQDRIESTVMAHHGGRARGVESPYLLAGFATCDTCGGPMTAKWKSGRRSARYVCTRHHLGGKAACPNGHGVAMGDADLSVVQALKEQVLTRGMRQIREETARAFRGAPQRARELEAEIGTVQGQVARLVEALASGQASPAIAKAIREREQHLDVLRAQLAQAAALLGGQGPTDDSDVSEPVLEATKLGLLWAMSLKDPDADKARARGALRSLVPGRIVFARAADGTWTFEGKADGRALLEPVIKGIAYPGVSAIPTMS